VQPWSRKWTTARLILDRKFQLPTPTPALYHITHPVWQWCYVIIRSLKWSDICRFCSDEELLKAIWKSLRIKYFSRIDVEIPGMDLVAGGSSWAPRSGKLPDPRIFQMFISGNLLFYEELWVSLWIKCLIEEHIDDSLFFSDSRKWIHAFWSHYSTKQACDMVMVPDSENNAKLASVS